MNKNNVLHSLKQKIAGMSHVPAKMLLVSVLLALPAFALKVTAQTKAEILTRLDNKDGIMPGDKDSIYYTANEGVWSLALGDAFQQDGQTITLFVNGQEVPFDNSLFVAPGDKVKIVGLNPGGVDDVYADADWGSVEGGSGPLALGITSFEAERFDEETRRPSFQLSLASSENTDYLYVSWFDRYTNTWKQWSDPVYLEGDFSGGERNIGIEGYPFTPSVYGSQLFRVEEVEIGGKVIPYGKIAQVSVPRGGELVYGPNPATTDCTINYGPDVEGELIVYNTYGEIVFTELYTGSPLSLDVSLFPPGMYGFELRNGGQVSIPDTFGKLVVVR